MDILAYNRKAWDAEVKRRCRWTIPVNSAAVAAARRGEWAIVLTPIKTVPRDWFPPLENCRALGLASGGGQQGPVLAAAGANVTILDNSPAQLDQDRQVSERENLGIRTVLGDMADLSAFEDASFDLIVHPCSNSFVPEIRPVWNECFRVLSPGGVLLSGFANPTLFIFDALRLEKREFVVRNKLPYSELTDLTDAERQEFINRSEPLMFGHTLGDQIGGQLDAGFVLTDMFEDSDPDSALSEYMPTYVATRAVKPMR